MVIGAWEALSSASFASSPIKSINTTEETASSSSRIRTPPFSFIAIALMSLFFILNSLLSFTDAINSHDGVGSALQLEVLSIALLFFLYSIIGILANLVSLPPSILSLIGLFGFVEEFFLFYSQRKDTSGIENRYFDLLLVPIAICLFSTILELKSDKSNYPRLARGVGLILQGTWFVQMGISFFTNLIAHGCSLHEKSRGNYTIKCTGHSEYHRGRAIATLQFNCHLAFVVVLIVGVSSIIGRKSGAGRGSTSYRPLGAEMQQLENQSEFTLDSDLDEEEIKEEQNGTKVETAAIEMAVNGYGFHL